MWRSEQNLAKYGTARWRKEPIRCGELSPTGDVTSRRNDVAGFERPFFPTPRVSTDSVWCNVAYSHQVAGNEKKIGKEFQNPNSLLFFRSLPAGP